MKSYSSRLSEEDKERIVSEFLPYIKYTASRLSWRLPPQLSIEDLISAGLMGLLESMERFEEGRVKLKTFAEIRIKGAMLDELRAVQWLPRSAQKKVDDIKAAQSEMQKILGRSPDEEEVAGHMGISLDDYRKTLQDASGAVSLRFEDFEDSSDGISLIECLPDRSSKDPLSQLIDNDIKDRLAGLIEDLPEKERLVLSLYYQDELTMKEIGRVLGLTESRVCQLHSQSLIKLRSRLKAA